MNLHKLIFTQNDCYKWNVSNNKTMAVKGFMLHSTAANNPYVKRYVGPDDGYLGKNPYNNHWNQHMDREVCVHGFIGKAANEEICSYQTLPWDFFGWHSGGGSKGTANYMGYIGVEICEDDTTNKDYFNKVYREAVELCAMLAVQYKFKAEKPYVICHSEGYSLGIASNHSDVMHWFKKHGKTMDDFRRDVATEMKKLKGTDSAPKTTVETGDVVQFLGGNVYANANADKAASTAKAGPATITRTYNGKHQYHLIHTDKQSTVYGWVDARSIKELQKVEATKQETATKKEEAKPAEIKTDKNTYKVGDIVYFKGGAHYTNANAARPASTNRTAGKAKVTATYVKGDHPYHLEGEKNGSNVFGWVNCADIGAATSTSTNKTTNTNTAKNTESKTATKTTTIKKGDKVKVKQGAKTFTGGGLASSVYKNTYDVIEVNTSNNRVVIGKGTAVTAAMNMADLIKV